MKKHIPILIALSLIALGIISACTKDTIKTDTIVFGNATGMKITIPDSTTFHGAIGLSYYSIDVNEDGVEDLQLSTKLMGSAALGHGRVIELKCTNEHIALYGEIIEQEKYSHIDSTFWYYYEPYFPQYDSICVIHIYETYTCERIDESDRILGTTEKLSLYDKDAGDTLCKDDSFSTFDVILKDWGYTIDYDEPGGNGADTIIYYTDFVKNDCDYFPLEVEKYIGYKYTDNDGTERIGWIKISLESNSVDYWGKLIETAIQQ